MAQSSTLTRNARSQTTSPTSTASPQAGFRKLPLARVGYRLFRICASLQLAISLLSIFTLCLIVATFLESFYDARIAGDLIYQTWWFVLLLTLLGVNVLCAALKKYPWKRHQTGFLVTHAGLIVLVIGGLLTNLGGMEGQMNLIDTENQEIHQYFQISNTSDLIDLAGEHQLEICRVPREAYNDPKLLQGLTAAFHQGMELDESLKQQLGRDYGTLNFWPGSLPWHADEHLTPEVPGFLRFLQTVADPSPGFATKLSDEVSLSVENFYPHTASQPFSPATEKEEGFPAMEMKLITPMTKRPSKRWVTGLPNFMPDPMPVSFEMFILHDARLLPEFLNPPPQKKLGKLGQLVLIIGEKQQPCRVNLDDLKPGKPVKLTDEIELIVRQVGNLLQMTGQGAHHTKQKDMPGPFFPAVQFELKSAKGKGVYLSCARMPHIPPLQAGEGITPVSAWYHHPDFRWGEQTKMGSLQFLRTADNRLYYRVFGKDGLKGPGKSLDASDTETVHKLPWGPMEMKFQVLTWIPRAAKRPTVLPRNVPPGARLAERLKPGLRCTLTNGEEKKDVLVRMSQQAAKVTVGTNIFFIRYRRASQKLDFALTLKKAQQVNDPGSLRAASYQSEVVLRYEKDGQQVEEDHLIYMNNTLNYGKHKVYQTQHEPLIHPQTMSMVIDDKNHLVSRSGLTVSYDPGLWAKYLGSGLLVLGIAIMFYMRAYFFKPRRKPA